MTGKSRTVTGKSTAVKPCRAPAMKSSHCNVTAARKVPGSREMAAAAGVADRSVAAASGRVATATAMASPATAAVLRQCRPSACQDQSQRAHRQQNAFALDIHVPLLITQPRTADSQDMFNKTLSVQRGSGRLVYITPA
jgi:hypothetical protein